MEKNWHVKIRVNFSKVTLIFLPFNSINLRFSKVYIYKNETNKTNNTDRAKNLDLGITGIDKINGVNKAEDLDISIVCVDKIDKAEDLNTDIIDINKTNKADKAKDFDISIAGVNKADKVEDPDINTVRADIKKINKDNWWIDYR